MLGLIRNSGHFIILPLTPEINFILGGNDIKRKLRQYLTCKILNFSNCNDDNTRVPNFKGTNFE